VKVSTLVVLVLARLNAAVTPLGSPETLSATLAASPTGLPTLMVLLTFAPPTRTVRLLAEADNVKLGTGTVTVMTVEAEAVADVPLTVTAYVPGTADALGVNVIELVVLVLGEPKTAVTPLGRPETVKATFAASPTGEPTVIVLLPVVPPTSSVRLLAEADKLKPGVGTTKVTTVDSVVLIEVPVNVTLYVPGTTVALGVKVSVLVVLVLAGLKAAVMPLGRPETARATLP